MRSRLQLDVCNLSLGRRHLVNACEVKAGIGVIAGNTVWSMPERLRGFTTRRYTNPLYVYCALCPAGCEERDNDQTSASRSADVTQPSQWVDVQTDAEWRRTEHRRRRRRRSRHQLVQHVCSTAQNAAKILAMLKQRAVPRAAGGSAPIKNCSPCGRQWGS